MKRNPIYDCGLTTTKLKMLPNGLDDRRGDANAGAEFAVKSLSSADKTAPMRAAERDHIEVVRVLAKHEARAKDRQGHDTLYSALKNGNTEAAETITPHEDSTDKNGVTALMCAAGRGDVGTVKMLIPLQKGKKMTGDVQINELEIRSGGTALMWAAIQGHAEVVRLLVEHEGGMQASGWSALMFAAQGGRPNHRLADPFIDHSKCVELLMESEGSISGWTKLMYAAYRGDVNVVQNSLHMKGSRDVGGWTALMYAAARGHERVVELLTEERGMTNNSHQTALMWAARNGHLECVKLLMKKEISMQNSKGWTALMNAAWSGHLECVRLLAEEEKDMKTTRERYGFPPGSTALDIAKRMGYTEIVSILSE
ncbi:Ankyrin repeat protein [Giardia duodenalis]|uniref:Ankyrin repeat protein n=1 Tax=Giardia intestinalis TaxID=5741 RepID=V6U2N7_GIAIN|nr:Ankyrin repeat protein [Giardia intestinalis]